MGFSVFPTPASPGFFNTPTVKHSLTSSTNLSIPSGTNMAYAVLYAGGSGGSGNNLDGNGSPQPGGAGSLGGMVLGFTYAATAITIGAGGSGGGGRNQSTQPAGSGSAGSAGGGTFYGGLITGVGANYSSNNARQNNPRNASTDGRFSGDGLNINPGAAGNAGSGNNSPGGAGGNGAAVILY
jgi:hypothetical protein